MCDPFHSTRGRDVLPLGVVILPSPIKPSVEYSGTHTSGLHVSSYHSKSRTKNQANDACSNLRTHVRAILSPLPSILRRLRHVLLSQQPAITSGSVSRRRSRRIFQHGFHFSSPSIGWPWLDEPRETVSKDSVSLCLMHASVVASICRVSVTTGKDVMHFHEVLLLSLCLMHPESDGRVTLQQPDM